MIVTLAIVVAVVCIACGIWVGVSLGLTLTRRTSQGEANSSNSQALTPARTSGTEARRHRSDAT